MLIQSIGTTLKTELATGESDRFYVESLFSALSTHLLRRYAFHKPSLQAQKGLPQHNLNHVLEYIYVHLTSDIGLDTIANISGMSRYRFCRLFKQTMGVSPYQYILQQRVELAKRLLNQSQPPIADIALQCGFANQSHFTRHFRQQTGSTPKRYRQGR